MKATSEWNLWVKPIDTKMQISLLFFSVYIPRTTNIYLLLYNNLLSVNPYQDTSFCYILFLCNLLLFWVN